MPGLLELCSHLDDSGIPRGLITRNVLRRWDTVVDDISSPACVAVAMAGLWCMIVQ